MSNAPSHSRSRPRRAHWAANKPSAVVVPAQAGIHADSPMQALHGFPPARE
ncbi:50S ribosomal protein L32 [Duganella sp. S19_KUP01_CR8]|uniref:50S ribosomal protein L32 n=1 Tax=Duganella sp. S19_KUP01_CR8 TaxID=3025502 RepID=UPI003FA5D4AA